MKIKLKKFLICLILMIILFPYNMVFAAVTLEEAQNVIASYAINCYTKNGTEFSYCHVWKYDPPGYGYRNDAYENDTRYDNPEPKASAYKNKLLVDCVGWTNYCVHRATGLDCKSNYSKDWAFVAGDSFHNTTYYDYFSKSDAGELKPGDLIGNSIPHIMVYVGDTDNDGEGEIVHCVSYAGLTHEKLSSYSEGYQAVYRLNSNALNTINKADLNPNGGMISGLSRKFTETHGKKQLNLANFYYNGIPNGKYSVTKSIWEGLIDTLAAIADFLLGIMTMGTRIVFVGWTALIETLITSTIKSITGSDDIESATVTRTNVDSGKNISIEKLVFNEISIFDVNFFNFNDEDPNVTNNP